MEKNTVNHSAHSTWRCQYHIVFAPKFRRKVIYGQLKADIGYILRKLCEEKKVEIIEAEACADHIHMLVSIPPHLSVAQFMGYLKGKCLILPFSFAGAELIKKNDRAAAVFMFQERVSAAVFLKFIKYLLTNDKLSGIIQVAYKIGGTCNGVIFY